MEQQNDEDVSMEINRQLDERKLSSTDDSMASLIVERLNTSQTDKELILSSTASPLLTVYEDTAGVKNQQKNEWVYINSEKKYFRRHQTRTKFDAPGTELGIDLEKLRTRSSNNEPFWYHATSWKKAEKFIEHGPKLVGGKRDCAEYPAFYLNPNFPDAYEWLLKKDKKFEGKHSILIYQFTLAHLPGRGRELNKKQHKEESRKPKSDSGWIYTYQTRNPKIKDKRKQPKTRQTSEGHDAMQLILYDEKLCRYIHANLIGCVFYDELNRTSLRSTSNDDSEDQTEELTNNSMECE